METQNNEINQGDLQNIVSGDVKKEVAIQNEWHDHTDTDKYLELEQDGVTFTDVSGPKNYSDYPENGELGDEWKSDGDNSRNSEAFNQDDNILRDNIDLDEDQNQSISSENI